MSGKRSNVRERWQRLRSAKALLGKGSPYADSVRVLQQRFGVSSRQAKRYLAAARTLRAADMGSPPLPKKTLTVSVDVVLLRKLRTAAHRQRCSVSSVVEEAVRVLFERRGLR